MKLHSPQESFRWLRAIWEHHRNSRMSRAQLEAAQLVKFRRLVAHAHEHSPYYRRIIEQRGIDPMACVPTDFPVLTKGDVLEHFDDLVTDRRITRKKISEFLAQSTDPTELFEGKFHVLHTSGTSGTVGYFVFSHEAWIEGSSHVVRASPLRLRRRIAFVAATRGHFAGVSLMLAGNDGTNRLFYDVHPLEIGQPLPVLIEALNRLQPHVLTGYATALRVLGEAQARGELRIHPVQIGNGGEPLSPELKAQLERVFGVPVLNAYASSEHLYMGLTLPGVDGLHLLEDDLIFELGLDQTCVTNLFNPVLPLIRYRMDDVLIPCTTGRSRFPYTRVKEVIGRHENALIFTNELGQEDFIHPIVIVELVVQGLRAWQVVLESKTSFSMRACLEPGLTAGESAETHARLRAALEAILAAKQMRNVRFEIEPVEELAIDPQTGKFRLVLRGPEYSLETTQRREIAEVAR